MRLIGIAFVFAILAGCASTSHVVTGSVRQPLDNWEDVKIYREPPPAYEEIAILNSVSKSSWSGTTQGKMDNIIKGLKKEAAELGANGVLLMGVGTEETVSGSSYAGTGYVGTTTTAEASALAIHVP